MEKHERKKIKKKEKKKKMTTTAHHGHHQRHATIAYEWLLKSVEIILFSRRGGDLNDETTSIAEKNREKKKKKKKKTTTTTTTKNSWWFNLHPNFLDNDERDDETDDEEIDEDEDGDGIGDASILLRKQLEPWRVNDNELGFNPTPLVLDIFHHHHRDDDDDDDDEKEQKRGDEEEDLVERWVLSVDPLNAPVWNSKKENGKEEEEEEDDDDDDEENEDGRAEDAKRESCVSPSYETSMLYKKAVIQTRVLLSLLRSLPAHRLERRARLKLRADAGNMFHKLYASTSLDCKPKNTNWGNYVWRTFAFSKIGTKVGLLHARCFFLDEHSLNESRQAPRRTQKKKNTTSPLPYPTAALSESVVGVPHKIEGKKDEGKKTAKVKGLLSAELMQAKSENRSKRDGESVIDTGRRNKPSKSNIAINSSSAPSNLFDAVRSTETCAADVPGTAALLFKASSFGREYGSPNTPYGSPVVRLEPPEQPLVSVTPRIANFAQQNEEELFALDEDVSRQNANNSSNTDMEIGALVRLLKDAPSLCPLDASSASTFQDAKERLEALKSKIRSSKEEDE